MNRLLNRANRRIFYARRSIIMIATALIGQLLGFLRVTVINGSFPDKGPQSTDAYFAASKFLTCFSIRSLLVRSALHLFRY